MTRPRDFFTDHVDVRPTLIFLPGLTDDYQHGGRVIRELLDPNILPSSLHAHSNTLLQLAQIYKQINAPFGELAEKHADRLDLCASKATRALMQTIRTSRTRSRHGKLMD